MFKRWNDHQLTLLDGSKHARQEWRHERSFRRKDWNFRRFILELGSWELVAEIGNRCCTSELHSLHLYHPLTLLFTPRFPAHSRLSSPSIESGNYHRNLRRSPLHLCRFLYLFRSSQGQTQGRTPQGTRIERCYPSRRETWRRKIWNDTESKLRKRFSFASQPSRQVRSVEQRFRCLVSCVKG